MKRVLVTGAAGFLGSHLSERFLEDGFQVFGMDNYITGSKKNIVDTKDEKPKQPKEQTKKTDKSKKQTSDKKT